MEQALRLRVEQGVVTSRSISVSLDMHWPTDEVRPHAWVPVLATVPALAMPPLPAWATVPAWDIVCQLYTDSAIAVLWARCELVASWACCGLGVAPNSWLAVWRAGALAAAQEVEVASTSRRSSPRAVRRSHHFDATLRRGVPFFASRPVTSIRLHSVTFGYRISKLIRYDMYDKASESLECKGPARACLKLARGEG